MSNIKHLYNQVQSLQAEQSVLAITSLVSFVAAYLFSALFPAVVYKFLLSSQTQMMSQPAYLEDVSLSVLVASLVYFLVAMVLVVMKQKKATTLKKEITMELSMGGYGHDCCGCEPSSEESNELAAMIDNAVEDAQKANKKSGKKSNKKTKSAKK